MVLSDVDPGIKSDHKILIRSNDRSQESEQSQTKDPLSPIQSQKDFSSFFIFDLDGLCKEMNQREFPHQRKYVNIIDQ